MGVRDVDNRIERSNMRRHIVPLLIVPTASSSLTAASRLFCAFVTATVLCGTAPAADWPQWRGGDGAGITSEQSGWPRGWPPKKLWTRNVGKGCTSPILARGRLYVMGFQGDRRNKGTDTLYCFEAASGKEQWRQECSSRYQGRVRNGDTGAYGGPSSTPTFDTDTGLLYTLSVDGDARCWDTTAQGKLLWHKNLYDEYKVKQRPKTGGGVRDYGYTTGPLVRGKAVLIEAGDDEGTIMAFDKKTGQRRWTSQHKKPAGHSGGLVPLKIDGRDCVAVLTLSELLVLRADTGNTVATFPWKTDYGCNIPTPAAIGNRVIVTSSYNRKAVSLLEVAPGRIREIWSRPDSALSSSPVIHKDRVYTIQQRIHCLDLATGRRLWAGGKLGHGSCLVTRDDKIITFGQGGLTLIEAHPPDNTYTELARTAKVVPGACYPHVALSDGILVGKDRDGNMAVFSVRSAAARPVTPISRPSRLPQRYLADIRIQAAGHDRRDLTVDVPFDFDAYLKKRKDPAPLDPASVLVMEANAEGKVIDTDIPWQRVAATATTPASLTLLLKGNTAADAGRRYAVLFDTRGEYRTRTIEPIVKVTDEVQDEGQACFKVETPAAAWYYQKPGAAFSSLIDRDGKDWIGYKPKGGAAGSYRGIPNLGHPKGGFHPGGEACTSALLARGPLKAVIESSSKDKAWATRWEIHPTFARLTVLKTDRPYWFLYEGTPGGALNEKTDFQVLTDGTRRRAAKRWTRDLPEPEWIAFGDPNAKRALFLSHDDDDNHVDSYWPMAKSMTVFGFGRHGMKQYITRTPEHFTVGLCDATQSTAIAAAVLNACRPLTITVDGVPVGAVPLEPARPQPLPAADDLKKLHDAPCPKMADAWPGNMESLEFAWSTAKEQNEITDTQGKSVRACVVKPRGKARLTKDGAMALTGGAMLGKEMDKPLLEACRKSNQLTVEAVLTPAHLKQVGPARIVSFSLDPYQRNFTLGQQGNQLILRLRTPNTGKNGMKPETKLCRIEADKPQHVVVSYSPGRLCAYLNGKRVLDTDRVMGNFSNWDEHHLLFGDEYKEARDWAGTLRHIALYSRVVGAAEAAARHRLATDAARAAEK